MSNLVLSPVIDLNTTVGLLKNAVPDWEWLLRHIESRNGFFRFPKQVTDFIERFRIENYPLLYQNEAAISCAFLRSLLSESEIKELNDELAAMSVDERGQFTQVLIDGVKNGIDDGIAYVEERTQQQIDAEYLAMSPEEQQDIVKRIQWFGMSCLSMFYQVLSTMVHRQKLTSLVAQAKAGDDIALVKAVQIDPRIAGIDPYFRSRFANLHAEGNEVFRKKLAYVMKSAPYRGKVRHKSLWMGLAFLDMCGHLDTLKHREILDLFDEAGIGGYANRIEDVKYLGKRIGEYRSFQQGLLCLSTP
ncbi:MAG: hypothetical protein V4646_20360 [Pseudomonadota bacterium]